MPARMRIVGLVLALIGGQLAGVAHAQTASATEYRLKSAFLVAFAKLIAWPDTAFAARTDSLIICVVGEDPFGSVLDAAVEGKLANGRTLQARRVDGGDISGCHIAFVSTDVRTAREQLVSELAEASILVVEDGDELTRPDGMLRFFQAERKLRFELNPQALGRAGLQPDPKLLQLATIAS